MLLISNVNRKIIVSIVLYIDAYHYRYSVFFVLQM